VALEVREHALAARRPDVNADDCWHHHRLTITSLDIRWRALESPAGRGQSNSVVLAGASFPAEDAQGWTG